MVDSFVTSNTALTNGGGLQVSGGSSADVHNTKFLENQVTMEADHDNAEYSAGGGAVAVSNSESGDVAFRGCSFVDNTDNTGHAADIFVYRGSATVDSSCTEDYEVSLVPNSERHALHSSFVHTCVRCVSPPMLTYMCAPLCSHMCAPPFVHTCVCLALFTCVWRFLSDPTNPSLQYWSTGLLGAALDTFVSTGQTIDGPTFSYECLPACPSGKTRGQPVSPTCSACDTGGRASVIFSAM